tara:strand:- start:351 stop:1478 length:1128 start_codon:yes stop_codon:yes gene_type:complete
MMPEEQLRRVTVMITGAGGAGYPLIFKALRSSSRYNVRIVAADVNPLAGNLYRDDWVDAAYCVPAVDSPDYIDRMLAIVKSEGVGFWLSAVDEELPLVSRNRELLASLGCRIVLPTEAPLVAAFDKRATNNALQDVIAIPKTIYPDEDSDLAQVFAELGNDVVIKACRTRGNRHNYRVDSLAELKLRSDQFREQNIDFMCQSFVAGDEYNISLMADAEGEIIYAVARQKIDPPRTRPNTFAGLVRRDAALEADAIAAVRAMKLYPGTSNVEFIKPPGGRGLAIDVNGGRHAAQDYNLIDSGINIPEMLLDMAHGIEVLPVSPTMVKSGRITLKFVDEYTIDLDELISRCHGAIESGHLEGLRKALQALELDTAAQ